MSHIEETIVRKTIDTLLAAGYRLKVDGVSEAWLEPETATEEARQDMVGDVFEVGEATLLARFDDSDKTSWVLLIPGNEEDIISDYGMNLDPLLADLLD